jgi:hypothetical protein
MAATWEPLEPGLGRSVRSVQAQTEAGPPADGAGVELLGVGAIVTHLAAPAGMTFDGAGWARGWLLDPAIGTWRRTPRADEDMTDGAGLAAWVLPSKPVGSTRGRFAWLLEGVGLTGGTGNVTVDMACTTPKGDRT